MWRRFTIRQENWQSKTSRCIYKQFAFFVFFSRYFVKYFLFIIPVVTKERVQSNIFLLFVDTSNTLLPLVIYWVIVHDIEMFVQFGLHYFSQNCP